MIKANQSKSRYPIPVRIQVETTDRRSPGPVSQGASELSCKRYSLCEDAGPHACFSHVETD